MEENKDTNDKGRKSLFGFLRVFAVKGEERLLMCGILLLLLSLHGLVIYKYYDAFTAIDPRRYYWHLFIHNFHVSGFDPITYSIVSDWSAGYNVYRHPLLAFFMFIPYVINQGLMYVTGINCAIFVVAAMQTLFAFYALLFFYRIMREVISLSRGMSTLMTLFFMSFAYVMLSSMVPDHFIISMMFLLLALYISGRKMLSGRHFKTWQSILYFVLTAGVSLNNGLKIFLAALFVNGRRFFRPVSLLLGVVLPALIIWGFSRWEYATFVWPQETARHKAKLKKKEQQKKKDYEMRLAQAREDSILRTKGDTLTLAARQAARANDAHRKAEAKRRRAQRQGAPISNGEFMRWTDVTSSRLSATVENLFGESIQLHQDHLLGDVMRSRPMVVHYRWWWSYVVEGIIVMLFAAGLWVGRRSRFLWLVMSFFLMDMALHIGLGFGINEVYIMAAHWIYALPIATAYIVPRLRQRGRMAFTATVSCLTLYLFVYNLWLMIEYFL